MSGREPEERIAVPVLRQRWRDVVFVHWRYPSEVVARLLPDGLKPDEHDGSAWVSLTPFQAEGTTVPPLPPVPGLCSFGEANLRTYVRGPGGLEGLWFLSLEVANLPTAVAGRLAVPYRLADVQLSVDGDVIASTSERRHDPGVGYALRVRRHGPLEDRRPLDDWLTGRWRAWVRRGPVLATVPVQHEPWPLERAELLECEQTLLAAEGLPDPGEPALVHTSPGVHAVLGLPRRRRRRGSPRSA